MWYAFGIITLLITNRMGGINGMSSVNISEKFDTQEQCVQYKEKVLSGLPKGASKSSYVECFKVDK